MRTISLANLLPTRLSASGRKPMMVSCAVAEVPGAKCDANPAQALIGQRADAVADKAKRLSGARSVRRYVTGAILTMDFRADRLNVETDAGGVIVKLTCG